MAAPKNHAKAGGRKKGQPNKVTQQARELFLHVVENEADNLKAALDRVRVESPAQYLQIMSKLYEYVLPKKRDITSDGDPITEVRVVIK